MPHTFFEASGLIGNAEWSLSTNTAGPDYNNNNSGVYQAFINTSGMLVGDEFTYKLYERASNIAGDLSLPTYQSTIFGPQSPPVWSHPALILGNNWEMTLVGSGVTGRNFFWSIRKG